MRRTSTQLAQLSALLALAALAAGSFHAPAALVAHATRLPRPGRAARAVPAMAASRDIGRPRGSQTGQKSRLLSDELRELGMDDELWARVENQRALTKLIKRGEIDRARERIVRLRELVADDSQDAARASATDAFVEEQQAALETVRNGASFEATVVDGPLVDEAAREVASGVVAAVDERIAQLSAEDAQLQKVKLEWLRIEGELAIARRVAREADQAVYAAGRAAPPPPPPPPLSPRIRSSAPPAPPAASSSSALYAGSGLAAGGRPRSKAGAIQKSTLAPPLARALDVLDLYDPTTLPDEEQDKVTGATLAGFLVVFPLFYLEFGLLQDLLLSTVFGAGVSGYCALRKDVVGKVTRDIAGGTTNLAVVNVVQRAEEIAEEYNFAKGTRERVQRQIKQLEGLKETAEVVAADGDVDVSVLYRRMDECLEKEEYAAATLIKERIDALTAGRG